jgi:outer membrane protein assembly factor BamB
MRRLNFILAGLLAVALAPAALALVKRPYPMEEVLRDCKFICTATVETLDADKPSAVFVVDDDLKGKFPTRRLKINMSGDATAKKLDHRAQILKRLAPKLPLVMFVVENGDTFFVYVYTNGTWFNMQGEKADDPEKTVWAFMHGEPYLRRTFKGTTEEMKKLVVDGLAKKVKLPAIDNKEQPGFGPEIKKEEKTEAELSEAHLLCLAAACRPARASGPLVSLDDGLEGERVPAKLQADKKWARILADQGNGMCLSTPLINGNRAYVPVAHGVLNRFGVLYCLDLDTQKVLWAFDANRKMKQGYSSPVLADGRLYFGEGLHEDINCKLYCIDAETGKQLWTFATQSHTEATPVVASGKVFFGAGDDGLYCVDAGTGKKCWQFTGSDKLHLHIDSTPAVAGNRVFCGSGCDEDFGDGDPAIFSLDADTGKPLWLHRTPAWTHKTGDKTKAPCPVPAWASPSVADGVVYFGVGNGRVNAPSSLFEPSGGMLAIDAKTGKEVWPAFKVGDGVLHGVAVDRDAVYFGSRDGNCYALERKTGKQRWKSPLGSPVVATPVPVALPGGNRTVSVFAVGSAGRIACLDAATGKAEWSFDELEKTETLLAATPVVVTTAVKGGLERKLYLGASLNGLSTPALYYLQDFQSN